MLYDLLEYVNYERQWKIKLNLDNDNFPPKRGNNGSGQLRTKFNIKVFRN